jgi:hypothetical protein
VPGGMLTRTGYKNDTKLVYKKSIKIKQSIEDEVDIQQDSKRLIKLICVGSADSFSLGGEQTGART